MYCVNCGVKLADTEKSCPLCGTPAVHPTYERSEARPMYPKNKQPRLQANSVALNGMYVIIFLIPLLLCFFSDFLNDGKLDWFGYVAGGILVIYIALALPLWFRKPNPVIFVPCNFASVTLYLLYVDIVTGGGWFLSFAFPIAGALCLITSAAVTLIRYLRRGLFYILGGTLIAVGGLMLLTEFLMTVTFEYTFMGWSIYPLITLVLFGGCLLYLAINRSAREALHRKLFF